MSDDRMNMFADTQLSQPKRAKDVVANQGSVLRLSVVVGENLRRLRKSKGYSLDGLARISGVSRAMLGQIECGKSAPTINLLGRVAEAMQVTIASLLSVSVKPVTQIVLKGQNPLKSSGAGSFVARALVPIGAQMSVGVYEVSIAGQHQEVLPASVAGTKMHATVVSGKLEIRIGDTSPIALGHGDSVLFSGDIEHSYTNLSNDPTQFFLVVS